jgi:hypothetical protein
LNYSRLPSIHCLRKESDLLSTYCICRIFWTFFHLLSILYPRTRISRSLLPHIQLRLAKDSDVKPSFLVHCLFAFRSIKHEKHYRSIKHSIQNSDKQVEYESCHQFVILLSRYDEIGINVCLNYF